MTKSDSARFAELMSMLGLTFNRSIEKPLIKIFWTVLVGYHIDEVSEAVNLHIANGKFFPVPAEIKALIPAAQGDAHLAADEAWAIAIRLSDEEDTVIYTQEVMDAWSSAKPILDIGDEVGARMAFRSAYERLPKSARPEWLVSRGNDKHMRLARIQEAVALGRLPASKLDMARLEQPGDMKALVSQVNEHLQIEGPAQDLADMEKIKTGLAEMRKALSGGYVAETSDARVAARRVVAEQQRERALGGVV